MSNIVRRIATLKEDILLLPCLKDNYKGLALFILDIRKCKSKESEIKRINREVSNIRSKFTTRRNLDSYQKKKSVAKLLFMYLLGYPIDFGFMEAINLAASSQFHEKSIGYMFLTVIFSPHINSELMPLVINTIRNDISSTKSVSSTLATRACANMCCDELIDALFPDFYKIFLEQSNMSSGNSNSPMCLYAMIKARNSLAFKTQEDVATISNLITSSRFTKMMGGLHLLELHMTLNPSLFQQTVVNILSLIENNAKINLNESSQPDPNNYYHHFYQPWTLVKLLKMLRLYNISDESLKDRLKTVCSKILRIVDLNVQTYKRNRQMSIKYGIMFEFVRLCIHFEQTGCMQQLFSSVTQCSSMEDPNLKKLALEALTLIYETDFGRQRVNEIQNMALSVLNSDQTSDLRRVAFDVLYSLCNEDCAQQVITEMIKFLKFCDPISQQNLTVKISMLAEKYCHSSRWYVDRMVTLIQTSGKTMSESIWYGVARAIMNNPSIQVYACLVLYNILSISNLDEGVIQLAAYILGECSNLISNRSKSNSYAQLEILQNWFPYVSSETKCIIVTTFAKLVSAHPELSSKVEEFLDQRSLSGNIDAELQQRVVETLAMLRLNKPDLLSTIFHTIPFNDCLSKSDDDTLSNYTTSLTISQSAKSYVVNPNTKKFVPPKTPLQGTNYFSDSKDIFMTGSNMVSYVDSDIMQFKSKHSTGCLFQTPLLEVSASITPASNSSPKYTIVLNVKNKTDSKLTSLRIEKFSDRSNIHTCANLPPSTDIDSYKRVSLPIVITLNSLFDKHHSHEYSIEFKYQDNLIQYVTALPVSIQHFIVPIQLSAEDYFIKWNSLSNKQNTNTKIFNSTKTLTSMHVTNTLNHLNLELLTGVDTNPCNYCAAGVLYSSNHAAGILLRLETVPATGGCRLITRSIKSDVSDRISAEVVDLLETLII